MSDARLQDNRIYSTMLWRLGYLGQGTLLRPHAIEFADTLAGLRIAPRDNMAAFLRHDLTRFALAELRIAIHDPEAPFSALMEQLRRIPRATAMLVAALLQESQPLHNISKVLGFDDISLSVPELIGSPLFDEIRRSLERHASPQWVRSKNVFVDAVALTVLAERIRRYRGTLKKCGNDVKAA